MNSYRARLGIQCKPASHVCWLALPQVIYTPKDFFLHYTVLAVRLPHKALQTENHHHHHLNQLSHLLCAFQVIFQQGSDGSDLFLIRAGYVRLLRDLAMKDEDRAKINGMTMEMEALQETMDTLASPSCRRLKQRHTVNVFRV